MSRPLTELLQTVQVAEPCEVGGLQVFGLRWQNGDSLVYRTLDEALADQTAEVSELSEGGTVPVLKVANKGETMLFLMAGEQLIGAKQNRVLNASIMVGARTELPIPVSCVEAGRWAYRSRQFGSHGTSSHGHLRKLMSKHAYDGYHAEGRPSSKQGEVWGEVSRKLASMGSHSPSSELEQAYTDHSQRLTSMLTDLPAPEGCCGAVFALGGKIAGMDLFDKPETLTRLWPKLIRTYAIDALEETSGQTTVPVEAVAQWLASAAAAQAEPFKSPGLGEDVRLKSDQLIAAGLIVEEQPVHVEMFPETVA